MPTYAAHAQPLALPGPEPRREVFSVPQPTGGFVYYEGPPGSKAGWNDNPPMVPVLAHPNSIGIASTALGQPLPPGSRRIGQGKVARGRITPMPGQGGPLPGLPGGHQRGGDGISGLGEVVLENGGVPWLRLGMVAAGAMLACLVTTRVLAPNETFTPRGRRQQKATNRALRALGLVDFPLARRTASSAATGPGACRRGAHARTRASPARRGAAGAQGASASERGRALVAPPTAPPPRAWASRSSSSRRRLSLVGQRVQVDAHFDNATRLHAQAQFVGEIVGAIGKERTQVVEHQRLARLGEHGDEPAAERPFVGRILQLGGQFARSLGGRLARRRRGRRSDVRLCNTFVDPFWLTDRVKRKAILVGHDRRGMGGHSPLGWTEPVHEPHEEKPNEQAVSVERMERPLRADLGQHGLAPRSAVLAHPCQEPLAEGRHERGGKRADAFVEDDALDPDLVNNARRNQLSQSFGEVFFRVEFGKIAKFFLRSRHLQEAQEAFACRRMDGTGHTDSVRRMR